MITLSKPSAKQSLQTVYAHGRPIGRVERLGHRWMTDTHGQFFDSKDDAVEAIVSDWRRENA